MVFLPNSGIFLRAILSGDRGRVYGRGSRAARGPQHSNEQTFRDGTGVALSCHFRAPQRTGLLDHFVCERKQLRRNLKSQRLGRLEVDRELEICRLKDGHVGDLRAFNDLSDVDASLAP